MGELIQFPKKEGKWVPCTPVQAVYILRKLSERGVTAATALLEIAEKKLDVPVSVRNALREEVSRHGLFKKVAV